MQFRSQSIQQNQNKGEKGWGFDKKTCLNWIRNSSKEQGITPRPFGIEGSNQRQKNRLWVSFPEHLEFHRESFWSSGNRRFTAGRYSSLVQANSTSFLLTIFIFFLNWIGIWWGFQWRFLLGFEDSKRRRIKMALGFWVLIRLGSTNPIRIGYWAQIWVSPKVA